jgi:hypothetical protein
MSASEDFIMARLRAEIASQDVKHGPFAGTRLGRSRLALACLEDEVREALDAWRDDRQLGEWPHMHGELYQVAAAAIRAIRDTA